MNQNIFFSSNEFREAKIMKSASDEKKDKAVHCGESISLLEQHQEEEESIEGKATTEVDYSEDLNLNRGAASAVIDNIQIFGQNVFRSFKKFTKK